MRILQAVILILLLAPSLSASSMTVMQLKALLPSEFDGWKPVGEDQIFTRTTIESYIESGAEITLGFPFRLLLVRKYADGTNPPLTVELYDMTTSGDAFGIFTHGPVGESVNVGQEALYAGGSLRFWKGNLFVKITEASEDSDTKNVIVGLGLRISSSIIREGSRPRIVSCLPQGVIEPGSIRYFHDQASVNIHYYLADETVLLLGNNAEGAMAKYRIANGQPLLILCRYMTPQQASKAFRQFSQVYFPGNPISTNRKIVEEIEEGEAAAALQINTFLIIVLEASDTTSCESLLQGAEWRIQEEFPPQRRLSRL
jgi:hypothetical protein